MNAKKRHKNLNEEENFEKELVQSLRYYGYLFPESSKDIENFEALYGDTEIDMPEHLESIEKIKSNNMPQLDYDLSYNTAAFTSNNHNDIELPDNLDLYGNEQQKDLPE